MSIITHILANLGPKRPIIKLKYSNLAHKTPIIVGETHYYTQAYPLL